MTPFKPQSRRSFLKSGAAAAATLAVPHSALPAMAAETRGITQLDPFGYSDVELLEGPLREQFDTNHAFYLALDEDMLLKPLRKGVGLPAPGDDMGGWYDLSDDFDLQHNFHGFAPGHSFGQMVSGLARAYAATGSKPTQQKVHRLVKGYAATVSPKLYAGTRFPAYTFDKHVIGLIDAHTLAGDLNAFKVLDATTDAALPSLPPGGLSRDQQSARPHKDESYCWDEPYTVAENQFLAYKLGFGARHLDMAVRFLADDWFYNPLAAGENVLPNKHAYSHVNCLSSAMQAYLVLGSEKHLRAAKNGFEFLRTTQSFATGGWGPDERFRTPGSGELGDSLTRTHASFETPCGSYAHFKLTRYLMRVTRDSRYGDSMERVLYNTVLGARPIRKDGHGFYYSDYNNNGSKFDHPDKWTCCSGSFPQITADYRISVYFRDRDGIYVNLFVPSRVKWMRGAGAADPVELTQRTHYPHTPATEIEVATAKAAAFPVYLRIPEWAGPKTRVSVNGKRVLSAPAPGQFAKIERTWKNGDRVEVEFDMTTRLEAIDPQHADAMAAVHGPLALFGVGAIPEKIAQKDLLAVRQVAAGSTDWQTETASGKLTLRPFPAIADEHYRLYFKTS